MKPLHIILGILGVGLIGWGAMDLHLRSQARIAGAIEMQNWRAEQDAKWAAWQAEHRRQVEEREEKFERERKIRQNEIDAERSAIEHQRKMNHIRSGGTIAWDKDGRSYIPGER